MSLVRLFHFFESTAGTETFKEECQAFAQLTYIDDLPGRSSFTPCPDCPDVIQADLRSLPVSSVTGPDERRYDIAIHSVREVWTSTLSCRIRNVQMNARQHLKSSEFIMATPLKFACHKNSRGMGRFQIVRITVYRLFFFPLVQRFKNLGF
jgi:hypothetical protein